MELPETHFFAPHPEEENLSCRIHLCAQNRGLQRCHECEQLGNCPSPKEAGGTTVRVGLVPTPSQCIETTAKDEYWRSVREYLRLEREDAEWEERIELLRTFLETMDFGELRRESEAHLLEGRKIKFVLYFDGQAVKYEMEVEGR